MRKLDRKLLRDLNLLRGQVLAIVLVIAAGVATFVMALCAYNSLHASQRDFYRDFRFGDVFSSVRSAPKSVLPRIEQLSGVVAVDSRLVFDVLLDVPGMVEPATARLISVPETQLERLNHVYVSRGRMVEPGRTGEVVVSEVFAEAHGLLAGDQVRALLNGRTQMLTIVGIAISPEYVIQIQPGSIMPDDRRFGIFWMNERDLESAFDRTGAFNSVSLKLALGANSDEVITQLDALLAPYGSIGAYGRDEQLSHQYLSDEIAQLRGTAVMVPSIFLSVAAFLLNMVVARIIHQQREQIAALKAFGYSNWEVGGHYLTLVLVISLVGTLLGTCLGLWMASGMTRLYQQYYRFPELKLHVDRLSIVGAFLLTSLTGLLGTWLSIRTAIALPPAEAMRPEPPPSYRPTLPERWLPRNWLSPELRMVLRNIGRKPIKSGLSVVGIAMAVAIMIIGSFSLDAVNYLMDFQFRKAQRHDLMATFVEPATASVIYEVENLPGVTASETMRAVATKIRFEHRERRVGIMGLNSSPQLYRLLDTQERVLEIPEHGLMLNSRLADVLGAQQGDMVTVEVLEGKRPTLAVEVAAVVEEYSGVNAYMYKPRLHALLKESEVASGAFFKVDANHVEQVFQELEQRPGVASVAIKDAVIDAFQEAMEESVLVMRSFIAAFASVIAVGVVYNSARISLSERSRDLATMRVVGFSQQEVSTVLLAEIALFTLAAIPLGWLIGYGLAAVAVSGLQTDNYRIPLVINSSTFMLAAVVVVVATLCSGWIVQRRVAHLDLIEVLKTRE